MEDNDAQIVIRIAKASEAAEIRRVTRRAFAPYRGRFKPEFGALRISTATIARQIRTGQRFYVGAYLNGKMIATLRCKKWPRHLGLSRLGVVPEAQHCGLGKRMMQWAEEEARRLGYRELRGEVRAAMPALLAYYKRMGYRPVRRRGRNGFLIVVRKRIADVGLGQK